MIATTEAPDAVLERLEIPLSVAECHGLACGLLCTSSSKSARTRWFAELVDAAGLAPDSIAARAGDIKRLDAWFTDTLEALNDAGLEFEPQLPDDDAPLSLRVRALGDYCAGFTYGFGLGTGSRGEQALPADTRELIADFQAIDGTVVDAEKDAAQDEGDGGGDNEAAFVELAEYVRVGVLLIQEELKPVTPVPASPPASNAAPGGSKPH